MTPHDAIAADRFRRSRGFWRLLALVAAIVAVLALWGRFAAPEAGGAVIARVTLSGTIATDAGRLDMFERLRRDESVKAVVVAINSPGGTTAGGEELYEALRRLSAEKPTVAVIRELGASAAYMAAIAAERVFARRLSIVGSIGVLYQHVNAGKMLKTIGIDFDKLASGPLKAEPDFNEPLNGPARQALAELVDDSFSWFVDIVAERRGLERAQALELADGRIVTGRQGVKAGLIDAIGGEYEALAWLAEAHDLDPDLPVIDVWPPPEGQFGWLANIITGAARQALGLDGNVSVMLDGLISLWQVEPVPSLGR